MKGATLVIQTNVRAGTARQEFLKKRKAAVRIQVRLFKPLFPLDALSKPIIFLKMILGFVARFQGETMGRPGTAEGEDRNSEQEPDRQEEDRQPNKQEAAEVALHPQPIQPDQILCAIGALHQVLSSMLLSDRREGRHRGALLVDQSMQQERASSGPVAKHPHHLLQHRATWSPRVGG